VPIVHKVGGLFDTVEDYRVTSGTGFVFARFDAFELYGAIVRALEIFNNQRRWKELVARDMRQSNSWEIPAKKYIDLYYKMFNDSGAIKQLSNY